MTPERFEKLTQVANKKQKDLTVIFENVHNPRNIAAVLRTCDSVGIKDVYAINTKPPKQHKNFNKRTDSRVSSSGNKWVNIIYFNDIKECVYAVRKNFDCILCSYLGGGAQDLYTLNFEKRLAFVFGNESDGVSKELKNLCDGTFVIPQIGMVKSLNISVACAVTLYEVFRQKTILGDYDSPTLNQSEIESFINQHS